MANDDIKKVSDSENGDGANTESFRTVENEMMNTYISRGNRYDYPEHLTVSPAPHVRGNDSTTSVMLDVVIALLPAFVWGIFVFGTRVLLIGIISVVSAVTFEFLFQFVMGRKNTVGDLSAVVTGLLLAMNLSSAVPYWMPVVGAFFAVVVVKGLFGGIGKNIVNPALAARIFLFAWPAQMNVFPDAGDRTGIISKSADMVASATPLAQIKTGAAADYTLFDLFIGNIGGCIGEISALFLIAGGIYLLARRVITWHIPVSFICTVAAIGAVFPRVEGGAFVSALTEVLSGGVIICSLFMATDYVTSPITGKGKIIFGIGCGLITMLIRHFGAYSEGASFAVLIMNLLVWYIDRLTLPKPFGGKTNAEKQK